MAGSSVAFTYDTIGPIKRIICDWVSDDAAGTASGTTKKVAGRLLKAVVNPGSAAPTDNYDLVLTDEEGANVLGNCVATSQLINRDTSNTETVYFFVLNTDASALSMAAFPVVCDNITFSFAAAGNSKTGRVIIYVEGDIAVGG